jgi:hypothetical protein
MKYFLLVLSIFTFSAQARVTCVGIPSAVSAGLVGPSPSGTTFWVALPKKGTMPIGLVSDELAKARFALALTAYTAGKTLLIEYYYKDSCSDATASRAIPNRVTILN